MVADPDELDDELDPALEAKLDAFLDRKLEKRAKQRQRAEAPKDFAELMDRFRDEIADVLETEFELPRKVRESDDPPSRAGNSRKPPAGGKRSMAERFFLGSEQTA